MEIPIVSRLMRMEPSLAVLLVVTIGAVAIVGFVAVVTTPVGMLVGDSFWEYVSAFHGLGATVFLVGSTIAVYLAWRLYVGEIRAFKDLKVMAAFSTVMSAFTIGFGNWIYIAYRSTGGPRSYFLETPGLEAIHDTFFEFKEFIALFTLPMFLVSTFILWRYGDSLVKSKEARAAASVPLLLGWVFLIMAYTLGAAITKLRGVG